MPDSICAAIAVGVDRDAAVDRADHPVHADRGRSRPTPRPPARRSCRTTRAPRCRGRGPAAAACPSRPSRPRASSAARWRGCFSSSARRYSSGSLPAACASSSIMLSITKRGVGVADRAPPQHRDAGLRRVQVDPVVRRSTCRYGESATPSTDVASMPSFTIIGSNGVPARIDWPTMHVLPGDRHARRVEADARADARTPAGSSRRACRPRASTRS